MPAAIKAALVTGKTIASRSSKVASRRHKAAHTFQFVLTPTRLVGAAGGFYKLKFTRGVKVACSPVREITSSMARGAGIVYADGEGRMSLLATLYREEDEDGGGDGGGGGTASGGRRSRSSAASSGRASASSPLAGLSAGAFDTKDAKLSLVRVAVGKKTEATVGKAHFDLAQFARMPSGDTPTTLRLSEKASVDLVIGCVYVPSKGRASKRGSDESSRLSGLSLGSVASSAAATDVSVRTAELPGLGIKGRRAGGGTTSRAMGTAAAAVAAAGGTRGLPPPPPSPAASSTTSSTARKVSFWSNAHDPHESAPPPLPPSSPLTPSTRKSASSSQRASSPLSSGVSLAGTGSGGRCTAPGCRRKDERIATLTAALEAATAAAEAAAARSRLRDGVIRELRERCESADAPTAAGHGDDMAREGGAAGDLGGGIAATAADVARLTAERDSLAEALRVAEKAASAAAVAAGSGGAGGDGVAAVLRVQDGMMRENAALRREVDELSAANEQLQDAVDALGPNCFSPKAGGGHGGGSADAKALAAARARAATLERELADARSAADIAATRAAADLRAAVAKADCAEASTEAVSAQLADALDALAGARQEADAAHADAAAAGVAVARTRSERSSKRALADAADAAAAAAANESALRATVEMGQARLAAAKAEAAAARAEARAAQVAVEEARGETAVAKAAIRAEREAVARAEAARVAAEATAAKAVAAAAATAVTTSDRPSSSESKKNRRARGADGSGGDDDGELPASVLRDERDQLRAQVRALETAVAGAREGGSGRARRAEAEAARLRETVAELEAELTTQHKRGDRGGGGGGSGGGRPPLPGGVTDERILMELLDTKLALASAVEAKLQLEYAISQVQRGGDRRLAGKLAEHASKLEVRLTAANTELQALRAREVEAAAAVAAGRVRESRRKTGGKRGMADTTPAARGREPGGRKAAASVVAPSSAGGRQRGAQGWKEGEQADGTDDSDDGGGGDDGSRSGSGGGSASDGDGDNHDWGSGGGGDGDGSCDNDAGASDDGDAELDNEEDEDDSASDSPPPGAQIHRGRPSLSRNRSRVRFESPAHDSSGSDEEG